MAIPKQIRPAALPVSYYGVHGLGDPRIPDLPVDPPRFALPLQSTVRVAPSSIWDPPRV